MVALLDQSPQDDAPVIAGSDAESDAVERLVAMDHVHLPKLVEYGFIEWNQDTHEVSKGPEFDEIRPMLELLAAHGEELPEDWL